MDRQKKDAVLKENAMRFEVKRNSKTVFWTEWEECIPLKDERETLKKTGHKLYIDGKVYTEKKGKQYEFNIQRTSMC